MKRQLERWFHERGWKPFKFQKDMWKAIANGESGLLHATTGAGKTYAVWLGALMDFWAVAQLIPALAAMKIVAKHKPDQPESVPESDPEPDPDLCPPTLVNAPRSGGPGGSGRVLV